MPPVYASERSETYSLALNYDNDEYKDSLMMIVPPPVDNTFENRNIDDDFEIPDD